MQLLTSWKATSGVLSFQKVFTIFTNPWLNENRLALWRSFNSYICLVGYFLRRPSKRESRWKFPEKSVWESGRFFSLHLFTLRSLICQARGKKVVSYPEGVEMLAFQVILARFWPPFSFRNEIWKTGLPNGLWQKAREKNSETKRAALEVLWTGCDDCGKDFLALGWLGLNQFGWKYLEFFRVATKLYSNLNTDSGFTKGLHRSCPLSYALGSKLHLETDRFCYELT